MEAGLLKAEVQGVECYSDYSTFCPTGEYSVHGIKTVVRNAIASARAAGFRKLMVVLTEVNYERPGAGQRYFKVREWAEAARSLVAVAVVVRPELVDSGGFAATVAHNAGFQLEYFVSRGDALAWLQAR